MRIFPLQSSGQMKNETLYGIHVNDRFVGEILVKGDEVGRLGWR